MAESAQPSTPADRDRARWRLRTLTRGTIIAAAGATVVMGVVVAHDRPGTASATSTKTQSSPAGTTGDSADAGTTGESGTASSSSSQSTTSTTAPTRSSSSATVTSGATS